MIRRVAIEPRFAAWRAVARGLLLEGIHPDQVGWEARGAEQLHLGGEAPPPPAAPAPSEARRVPPRFLELAEAASFHTDPGKWALLYALLWRLTHGEPRLMEVATDPDVHRLLQLEKAVRREVHKMKAFVRFREVALEDGSAFVAWFEPEHPVLRRAAPFFAERFASMRWTILTPAESARWEGGALCFGPGVDRSSAPSADALEALWRTYYASTFNPARLKTRAMRAEMPLRYWKNLPEAELIQPLIREAGSRVRRMLAASRHAE